MVKFSKDDVCDAVIDALLFDKPDRYVRLRDAVRDDARKTGNVENYQKFVSYTDSMIRAYISLMKLFADRLQACEDGKDKINARLMA